MVKLKQHLSHPTSYELQAAIMNHSFLNVTGSLPLASYTSKLLYQVSFQTYTGSRSPPCFHSMCSKKDWVNWASKLKVNSKQCFRFYEAPTDINFSHNIHIII